MKPILSAVPQASGILTSYSDQYKEKGREGGKKKIRGTRLAPPLSPRRARAGKRVHRQARERPRRPRSAVDQSDIRRANSTTLDPPS